jgi:hypothetical protein
MTRHAVAAAALLEAISDGLVAGVDRFLPIQRQAVGISGEAIWARSASVGMPLSMIWGGAGAWITPSRPR